MLIWRAPAERSSDGAFRWTRVIPKAVSRYACHRSPKLVAAAGKAVSFVPKFCLLLKELSPGALLLQALAQFECASFLFSSTTVLLLLFNAEKAGVADGI